MPNFRFLFLYNILPKKRLLIAFIGFLLSSIIISGGAILMFSIVSATTSYLGESDDILIITKEGSSTPYTSQLPLDFVEAVRYVPGVIDVCPEVLTAAVYQKKAIYFRGVDPLSFWYFTPYSLIDGIILDATDTFNVTIGINFARKNNLQVGDYLTLYSTKSSSTIELRVKSIIFTGTLLDDELIAPLAIGQFFTFNSFNYITHVRVKIDLSLTSKEKVKNMVLQNFKLKVNLRNYNETTALNATVFVQDLRGTIINTTKIVNDNSIIFELPFRMYEIYATLDNFSSNKTKVLPGIDLEAFLFIPYLERKVNFTIITEDNEPIENAKISITQQETDSFGIPEEKVLYTNSEGIASTILSNGSYVALINYNRFNKKIYFTTGTSNNFEIILVSKHPQLEIRSPLNNSIILGSTLNLSIVGSPGYSIYYYFDNSKAQPFVYYSEYSNGLAPLSLIHPFDGSIGEHALHVITKNIYYSSNKSEYWNETFINFTVVDFPESLDFDTVTNMSNLYSGQILTVNFPFNYSYYPPLYKWDNGPWLEVSDNQIISPSTVGIHKLDIELQRDSAKRIYTYYFSISEENFAFGLYNLTYHNTISPDNKIQVWYNNLTETLFYSWDNSTSNELFEKKFVLTTNLKEGSHLLDIGYLKEDEWHNRSYTIFIDKSSPNLSLSFANNSLINSGDFIYVSSNETLKELEFSWNNQEFSRIFDSRIPCPYNNGSYNLTVRGYDLVGNKITLFYNFSIVNQSKSNVVDFFLSNEYANIINETYIELDVHTLGNITSIQYRLEGALNVSGNYTENQVIYLYSGEYDLFITLYNNSEIVGSRSWTFSIMNGINKSNIFLSDLAFEETNAIEITFPTFDVSFSLNSSSSIYVVDQLWDIILSNSTKYSVYKRLLVDTTKPAVTIISPKKGCDSSAVWLDLTSAAVEIFYKIDDSSTFIQYVNPIQLANLSIGEHKLQLVSYDTLQNKNELTYLFSVGLEYVTVNLTFVYSENRNITLAPFYSFQIRSTWNDTQVSFQTDVNGTAIFKVLKGTFYISISYEGSIFEFPIKVTSSVTKTIYIGESNITILLTDIFANTAVSYQDLLIYKNNGLFIKKVRTNSTGGITFSLDTGIYSISYEVLGTTYSFDLYVYGGNHIYTFQVPSNPHLITFSFVFSNNTQAKNLPVIIETEFFGNISLETDINGEFTLSLPYQIIVVHIFSPTNKLLLSLTRHIEPGISSINIVIPGEKTSTYQELPFENVIGSFDILISLSSEYMDHYLRGSLLFTYTLAYAEVILIVLVVSANLYAILRNLHRESRKEIKIVEMIGGTNPHIIFSIFSRLLIIASFSFFIGYFVGNEILKMLAKMNRTVFFGHTFTPQGNLTIFILCYFLVILSVGAITGFIILMRRKNERKRRQQGKEINLN